MAQKKYEIVLEGVKAAKTLGQLKEGTEELKRELEGLEIGTKEFENVAREIQKADSKLKDFERTFESADMEGRFGRLGDVIGGVTRGVGAFQGALVLMGDESQEAEEAIAKMMAAMAIADAAEGFGKMISAIQKMGNVTKIATSVQAAFNIVLNLNPIGLIVIAVAALVAGIILMIDQVRNAINWFKELDGWAKVLVMIFGGPLIAVIGAVVWALEQLGVISDAEESAEQKRHKQAVDRAIEREKIIKKEIDSLKEQQEAHRAVTKDIEARYNREIELATASGQDVTEIERAKFEDVRNRLEQEMLLIEERHKREQEMVKQVYDVYVQGNANLEKVLAQNENIGKEAVEKRQKAEVKVITDSLVDIEHKQKLHEAKTLKAQRDAAKAAADEAKKANDEKAKADADARQKYLEKELELNRKLLEIERERQRMLKDAKEKALAEIGAAELELINTNLFNQTQLEIMAVDMKYAALIEKAKEYGQNITLLEQARTQEIAKIQKAADDKARADEQANFELKVALVQQGLTAINELIQNSVGQNEKAQRAAFAINKAFGIATATLDTYMAAQKIFAAAAANPASIAFPALPYIQAGIAITSGLARVAAIARTKFGGTVTSGGGGGGGGGGGQPLSIEPPRLANVSGTVIDGNRDNIQDNRVKVVESDIKAATNRVQVIESQANIK